VCQLKYINYLIINILGGILILYTQSLPPIQSFPMEEYAAGNQNWMLTQGSNNQIYVANNEGVLSFDAERWKLYPTSSIVRSVAYFEGVLYSGSYMDFGYWTKQPSGELTYQSLVVEHNIEIIEDEQFWNIYKIEDNLVFQSLNRILLFNRTTKEIKSIQPEKPILKSFVVDDRLYFQLEGDGIYQYSSTGITYLFGKREFQDTEVIELFPLSDGLRVLTSSKGFYSYRNNVLRPWAVLKSILQSELVYSGLQSNNGNYVIGTVANGVYIVSEEGRDSKHFNFEKGLLNNTVLSIYEDKDFNLWLGLDNGINCLVINSPFEVYNDSKGQLGTVYASIRFQNKLFIATNRGLFFRPLNPQEPEFYSVSGLSGQNWNLEIVNGVLFVGHDRGSFIVNGETAIRVGSYIGAWTHRSIDRNTILVGAYDGIHVLKRINGVWKYAFKVSGFDISSRHLETINEQEVLISHEYKGVYHLTLSNNLTIAKNVRTLAIQRGRHASLEKLNNEVYYLSPDGMFRYDTQTQDFLPLPISSEMFKNDSFLTGKMIVDQQNRIWTFFEKNIVLLEKNIFDSSFSVQKVPLHSDFRKTNLGFENVGDLNNGSFVLGTMDGFLTLSLSQYVIPESLLFLSRITAYNLDQKESSLSLFQTSKLTPEMNNLRFEFSVPYYSSLNSIQYQWYMEGYHTDWLPWSDLSFAEFKNLDFGNYIFYVRARIGQQPIGEVVQYSFSILYPWYISYWAIAFYVVILVFLSLLINDLYTRYYRRQQIKYVEETKKELALKELSNTKALVEAKNDQLNQRIENKNRELAISTMSMIKKNTLLGSIKDQLVKVTDLSELKKVVQNIDQNINNDDDWNFFEEAFNNADQDFLKKIKEIHPKLTPNDLRLCAYLRLNLSSKEIASLLNISSKSVEIKRYRLRKRMNLDHGTNLIGYILSV
jgi:AraC family chitin signaling transcriptional activator